MKQNYGEGFPQVDFMKCVTGRRMEIQAGVGIWTMLEGLVNAGQLLGDPEHRVIGTLCLRDVSSQETFYFTVSYDIKCIVYQNSGGTELGYCLRQ